MDIKWITARNCVISERVGKQVVQMEFGAFSPTFKRHIDWHVSLIVFTKRKRVLQHFDNCEITGLNGAQTFIIALRMLKHFEEQVVKDYPRWNHRLLIDGSDNLRRKIYNHFLPRYGYRKILYEGHYLLMKEVSQILDKNHYF